MTQQPPPTTDSGRPAPHGSGSAFDQSDVFAAATGAGAFGGEGGGRRARLRNSRLGTLLVLAITAVVVVAGAWLVGGGGEEATTADGGSAGQVSDVDIDVEAQGPPPEVGAPAQDFTATTLDGTPVSLSDLQGRPVWLVFGATWCSACRAEQPDVQDAATRYGDDLVVLSVYLGEDERAVRDYSDRLGITYAETPDPTSQISASYRVMGVPTHFFIDADGVLQGTTIGALAPKDIDAELAAIL